MFMGTDCCYCQPLKLLLLHFALIGVTSSSPPSGGPILSQEVGRVEGVVAPLEKREEARRPIATRLCLIHKMREEDRY